MVDRERPGPVSGERRGRRGAFGCAVLLLAALVAVGALVWIDQRDIGDPAVEAPPPAAPVQPGG